MARNQDDVLASWHVHSRAVCCELALKTQLLFFCFCLILQGTKPGEVGKIFALYWLKSLSLDYKVKLKSPCFFLQVTLLAKYLRFMVKLIDKAIVINVKIHKNERKRLYSSNKEDLICWYKSWKESQQTSVNLYWRNSRWKLNPKSKNIQTDACCTKLAIELCCILIILTKLELFVAF